MLSGLKSDEFWRGCIRWLVDCNIMRKDHRINTEKASIVDFAHFLRDGVFLCNLLHAIDPESIDLRQVNLRPQMAQFLCLKNIQTFLNSCQTHFEIEEDDLFEPCMLFELSDFHNVLFTLSKLSNGSKFLEKKIRPFTINKLATHSEEDIYRDLQSVNLASQVESYQTRDSEENSFERYYTDLNEDVYHDLCSITLPPKTVKTFNINNFEFANEPVLEKRDHVIKELIDTESNYVNALVRLQKHFIKPLANCISSENMDVIFFGIKDIVQIHIEFLNSIRRASSLEYRENLSDVFLNWRERFLIYGPYCANLPNALNLLQELYENNDKLANELIKCQNAASSGKFKLSDMLSVPMQRILKYHLLLSKLIEETEPSHEDYKGLKSAKSGMDDVALCINEVKRDSDHLELLTQLKNNITDWNFSEQFDLTSYGRLLMDGEVRIKAHEDQKTRNRYIFVFNKVMIMCKLTKGSHYSFRDIMNLEDLEIDDANGCRGFYRETRWSYQCHLIRRTTHAVYTIFTRTYEVKRQLVTALQIALDELDPIDLQHTDHKFEMQTFPRSKNCSVCPKFLKGLILQGYLCNVCQSIVHKECIKKAGRCPGNQKPVAKKDVSVSNTDSQLPVIDDKHLWFVGEMDRDTAEFKLNSRANNTFLVRIRPALILKPGESPYALSLKTKQAVKHMKIFEVNPTNDDNQYFLSNTRYFKTISDLVNLYEDVSLMENYEGLDEKLKWPYRQILCVATSDFNHIKPIYLTFKQGDHILIINKKTHKDDLWRGRLNNNAGFFPSSFVNEEKEITYELTQSNY